MTMKGTDTESVFWLFYPYFESINENMLYALYCILYTVS